MLSPRDWGQVADILRLVRTGSATTRPELAAATQLGRNIVTQRVQQAEALGLIQTSGAMRSRGGRAAEVWEFAGQRHHILLALFGANEFRVALADLGLNVIAERAVPWTLTMQPEDDCQRVMAELVGIQAEHPAADVWGMGIGMLAPVNFVTGRSSDPVTSSSQGTRWPRDFDVRGWFMSRLGVPVWVESVANLATLGVAARNDAPGDLITVRIGPGVGSGIVSGGRLHRGAEWISGELTHVTVSADPSRVCVCGRIGCIETFVSDWAIVHAARAAVTAGRSPVLLEHDLASLSPDDVVNAAARGDVASVEIVLEAAEALGKGLAFAITWFNPKRVVLTGSALATSPLFVGAVRRTMHVHTLAASLENLELVTGDPQGREDVSGGLSMVRERLLSRRSLAEWGPAGSPVRAPRMLNADEQP